MVSEKLSRSKLPMLWSKLYRIFYPRFDAVICQSVDMLNDLTNILGENRNLFLVNNPVDETKIRTNAIEPNESASVFFRDNHFTILSLLEDC